MKLSSFRCAAPQRRWKNPRIRPSTCDRASASRRARASSESPRALVVEAGGSVDEHGRQVLGDLLPLGEELTETAVVESASGFAGHVVRRFRSDKPPGGSVTTSR